MIRSSQRAVAVCLVLVFAVDARAQTSGVQVTPNSLQSVVSKDVGEERWAIMRSRADGSVIGNVFFSGGGEPQFLWCEELEQVGTDLRLRCLGADRCLLRPCTAADWTEIAELTVPLAFFEPPGAENSAEAVRAAAPQPVAGAPASLPAGVQRSPDKSFDIVSKDVGTERWAITRSHADGSVVGNVFSPGGGEPAFVWCEELSGGVDLELACYGATRCESAPCEGTWTFLQDVTIPASFFSASDRVAVDDVGAVLTDGLGDREGTIAVLLALDGGYSLRQVVAAALAGRLSSDGVVSTAGGGVAPPAGEPLGVFAATPAARGEVQQGSVTPGNIYDQIIAGRVGDALPVLLGLVASGYSVEQISGLFFGLYGIAFCPDPEICEPDQPVLLDDFGQVVTPENPPAALFEDFTPPPGEDDPPPWTFRGEVILENDLEAHFGSLYNIQPCPAELTFDANGMISGTMTCSETFQVNCPSEATDDPGSLEVTAREITSEFEGSWSANGGFELDLTSTKSRNAPLLGTFDAHGFFAERSFKTSFEVCATPVFVASEVITSIDVTRVP